VKITVEMTEKVKELECEGATIVTNRGEIIAYAHACSVADILATVAGLDIAFNKLLTILHETFRLSDEEIRFVVGDIKSKLADM